MASKVLQNLKRFSTCDIGDALVKLKHPYGGFLDGLKMFSPEPGTSIYGPAVTVKMVETKSPEATPSMHFADANKEGHVMYIQQPKGLPSACWGGLMSTRAQKLGALGVIIDGRMRDTQEHRDISFPVFARGTSVLGSNSFTRASEINVPLQFRGDLWIHPSDMMVGDENGVVVVPSSLMEQVVELCQERYEIDEKTFAALRAGRTDTTSGVRYKRYVSKQHSLPAAYYRGGTSRAVVFNQSHLPPRPQWDNIFRGVIGSPDSYGRQLDGLGGGISSLSKVCVVGRSTHPDADVDYTFASLGVKNTDVDYSSNCGNMISAIGPFAIDQKLVSPQTPDSATVRIHNTNTGKIITATFPVVDGEAASSGDFAIDGVSGTAARIQLDFVNPAGSVTGKMLPTGNATDEFDGVQATCIDVANPCVFVQAKELGVRGDLTPDEITSHPDLLKRLDSIRRQAGVKMGIAKSTDTVPGSIPKICMVSAPKPNEKEPVDLLVRAISVGQPHKAVPITVALAVSSAARVAGSTVEAATSKSPATEAGTTIGHASGNLLVGAQFDKNELVAATVFRTARRLFDGKIYWKS
ncbi:PrpF protein [Penicillium angulare]|uniref:PrpF protein n=1 Tax=Penicillium angulare TaxID=116970 RepID=A0A9W9K0V8_9EURO|nr:PrpF protein [Penicillium angulare]